MKVLHINYYDIRGGAALASYRLCKKQRELGIDASMVVAEKFSSDPWVIPLPKCMVKKMRFLQRCEAALYNIIGKKENFMPRSLNLFATGAAEFIENIESDVLHLHWINGQMLSIEELTRFQKPLVWTLHDTWAYCGTEHHHLSGDKRYKNGYKGGTLEDIIWRKKYKAWQRFSPVIVGPSAWIVSEVAESKLFNKQRVEHIFNGIELNDFRVVDKTESRIYWGINTEKPIVVIGAASFADENKGGKLLRETLACLPDVFVLAVGKDIPPKIHPNILCTGDISDQKILALAYGAGDVFFSAARYDNLPNMLIESIACGTPVVALDTGGVKEIIEKSNGLCVTVPDGKILAGAIRRIIEKQYPLSLSAYRFDIAHSASEYMELYQSIIEK